MDDTQSSHVYDQSTEIQGGLPLAINIYCNEIVATDCITASHILIDYISGACMKGEVVYDHFGVSTLCYALWDGEGIGLYYATNQKLDINAVATTSILNSIFAKSWNVAYNAPLSLDSIIYGLEADKRNITAADGNWFKRLNELGKAAQFIQVSAHYQRHFLPEHVFESVPLESRDRLQCMLRLGVEIGAAAYSGIAIWLVSLEQQLYDLILDSNLLDSQNYKDFSTRGKLISTRAKRLQNLTCVDLKPLFECDVLVNRVQTPIDWRAEKLHRIDVNTVKIPSQRIFQEASRLFKLGNERGRRYKTMTMTEMWRRRWEWSTSGAVHCSMEATKQYVSTNHDFKNKFISTNAMPLTYFASLLKNEPAIHCSTSIKYEWGKQRAIYGTDIESYLITALAMSNCEELLPNCCLIGSQARESYVASKLSSILHQHRPFCIDFEDFNSQHSTEAMQAVLWAFLEVQKSKMSEDQIAALLWTIDSLDKVIIHDNVGTNTTYKCEGTLVSGWRLTSFMNTVLNYCYTQCIAGLGYTNSKSVHSGDDILYAIKSVKEVQRLYKRADDFNIRLSATKCCFGSIAEFLRVDHTGGVYGQYLARSIATLVHSRMESLPAYDIRQVVEATETRISEFIFRQGHEGLAQRLRDNYLSRLSADWTKGALNLQQLRHIHRVAGGTHSDLKAAVHYKVTRSIARHERPVKCDLPLLGVQDYTEYVVATTQLDLSYAYVRRSLYETTMRTFVREPVRYEITPSTESELKKFKVWRGIYKAHAGHVPAAAYGRAKLLNVVKHMLDNVRCNDALKYVITDKSKASEMLNILV